MKRPWNLINLPVYSLATYGGEKVNMNICTYVSAISMNPKKYSVAVYENTRSLSNLESSEQAVLQLLHSSQFGLVKMLGHKSGNHFDKQNYLQQRDLLENWEGQAVLKNTSAKLLLKKSSRQKTGDHDLFIFDVLKYKSHSADYLTMDILRQKKLIRI